MHAQIRLQSVSSGDGRLHTPIAHARAADQPHSRVAIAPALFSSFVYSDYAFISPLSWRQALLRLWIKLHPHLPCTPASQPFLGNSIHHQECTSGPACTASVSPITTRELPSSPARPSFHPISARRVLFMHRDCAALARPLSVLAARLCLVSGAFQIQPTPVSSVSPKNPSDPPQTGIY